MTFFTGIMVYLMVFWTVLFTVLPWGNRAPECPEGGQAGSAPVNPRIGRKFLITAVISTLIWVIVWWLVRIEAIDFYAIARDMVAEDKAAR
jgi:predicted secreted protein